MLKSGILTIEKQGIKLVDNRDRNIKAGPWIIDSFAFFYDSIMRCAIFPQKFGSDMQKHYKILAKELAEVKQKRVLEIATGSGSAVKFLDKGNDYTGIDINPGLLKLAKKRFHQAGFQRVELYLVSADSLPFTDATYDICLCVLALNFLNDLDKVITEIKRVLLPGGTLLCSVPVPERNWRNSEYEGTLRQEIKLINAFQRQGFRFEALPDENGALFYFKAVKA
jgi:ubiquinone/menaquinone biosynthesis C-methylase UbiE